MSMQATSKDLPQSFTLQQDPSRVQLYQPTRLLQQDFSLPEVSCIAIDRQVTNLVHTTLPDYTPISQPSPFPPPLPRLEIISSHIKDFVGGTLAEELSIPTLPLTFEALYNPARLEEQKSHFSALSTAVHRQKEKLGLSSLAEAVSRLTEETIGNEQKNRLFHLLCRLGALDPELPQEGLFEKVEKAMVLPLTIEEQCQVIGISLSDVQREQIARFREQEETFHILESPQAFSEEKAHLKATFETLEQLIQNPPAETFELEMRNRKILLTLRDIFSSPLYQALCTSTDHPFITIAHSAAIEQYSNTYLAPAFTMVGSKLPKVEKPLPERVQTIWNQLSDIGVNDGILSTLGHYVQTLIDHTFQWLRTVALPYIALKICQLFSLNCFIPHIGDERSILGSTPGATVDELQESPTRHRSIRTVVLAAPTLGFKACPVFKAALQALENNQFSPSLNNPFLAWAYTNLQTMAFTPEHPSSIALMALQQEFPLSFQAITLPQQLPESSEHSFSEKDMAHHLFLLFQNNSTSLENRGITMDAGYYLPRLQKMRPEIEDMAKKAFALVDHFRGNLDPALLKNAFYRLLHLGISRLHENTAYNLVEARTQRTAISVLRSTICASCIDRGGQMNTAYIHAFDTEGNLSELTTGAYFGRAILSHRRSPTKTSVDNLAALFSVVPQAEVRDFLTSISPVNTILMQAAR